MAKHERRASAAASRLVFFPPAWLFPWHFPPRRRTHVRDERQGEQAHARHRPDRGAELATNPAPVATVVQHTRGGSPRTHTRSTRGYPRGPWGEPRVARAAPVPPAAHVSAVVAHGRHARHPHPDDAPRQPRVHLQPLRLLRRSAHVPRRDVLHAVPGGPRRVGRQSRRLLRHRLDHPRPLAAQSAASRPR